MESLPITRSNEQFGVRISRVGKEPVTLPSKLTIDEEILGENSPAKGWQRHKTRIRDRWGNLSDYSTLCFNEPMWVLEASYNKTIEGTYKPEELLTVQELELPTNGTSKPLQIKKTFGKIELELLALAGKGVHYFSNRTVVASQRGDFSGVNLSASGSEFRGFVISPEPILVLTTTALAAGEKVLAWIEDDAGNKYELPFKAHLGKKTIYQIPTTGKIAALKVTVNSPMEIRVGVQPSSGPKSP
jgi:hypothetical protein